jgi:hypothetical protein
MLELGILASRAVAADRTVHGTVFYKDGEPAPEVAVQLEDRATSQIVSHRTDHEGHYRFVGLSSEKDYELRAVKNGHWSKSRTVSRFSSRAEEVVNLYLRAQSGE